MFIVTLVSQLGEAMFRSAVRRCLITPPGWDTLVYKAGFPISS